LLKKRAKTEKKRRLLIKRYFIFGRCEEY